MKEGDRQKMKGPYPYYGATGIVDYVNDYRLDGDYLLISEDGKALEFRNYDIAFIRRVKYGSTITLMLFSAMMKSL